MRVFAAIALAIVALLGAASAEALYSVPAGEEDNYTVFKVTDQLRARYPNLPAEARTLYFHKKNPNAKEDAPAPADSPMKVLAPGGEYENPNPDGCVTGLREVTMWSVGFGTRRWCARNCSANGYCQLTPWPVWEACAFFVADETYQWGDYCGAMCDSSATPDECAFIGPTALCQQLDPSWGVIGVCSHP